MGRKYRASEERISLPTKKWASSLPLYVEHRPPDRLIIVFVQPSRKGSERRRGQVGSDVLAAGVVLLASAEICPRFNSSERRVLLPFERATGSIVIRFPAAIRMSSIPLMEEQRLRSGDPGH